MNLVIGIVPKGRQGVVRGSEIMKILQTSYVHALAELSLIVSSFEYTYAYVVLSLVSRSSKYLVCLHESHLRERVSRISC